ncbi:MAG: aminotransferase class III-fold pyridoxal phosphate-dependent enzyme [Pseudomonadota bacterium]
MDKSLRWSDPSLLDFANMDEDELMALEAEYCSHGDTVHYMEEPKLFERCEGSFLYDGRDVPYLDLQMWHSAVNFGYSNERLSNSVRKQLDRLPQVSSKFLHREKIELATRMARRVEKSMGMKGRVHFNVGGAQANEDALKLVRNATGGKTRMFAFEGGYHGRTLGTTAITSSYRYRRKFGDFPDRAQFVPFPYCFRCPYGKKRDSCDLYCVDQFARLFDSEYHSVWDAKAEECEFAAFFAEPIQGTGGYIVPPEGYFEKLKGVLEARKILLVDDEVQMGFYRAGKFWAMENFGVKPDVIVFGKSLTNGLNPLSGLWAREELISPDIWGAGMTHSTYSSNPLGTAVALENVRMMEEGDYETITAEKGAYFLAGLRDMQAKYPGIVGNVDGLGLALRMELCEADGFTPNPKLANALNQAAFRGDIEYNGRTYGMALDVGGYYKNTVVFAPNINISRAEIDLGLGLVDALMERVLYKE